MNIRSSGRRTIGLTSNIVINRWLSSSIAMDSGDVLVACNVYVTAGGEQSHRSILKQLLQLGQSICSNSIQEIIPDDGTIRIHKKQRDYAVVVHAYIDPIYNRSSFHLAGTPTKVSDAASHVASKAVELLHFQQQQSHQYKVNGDEILIKKTKQSTIHPTIGLVDHISVMPLLPLNDPDRSQQSIDTNRDGRYNVASVEVARIIGKHLARNNPNLKTFYYGDAHPDRIPLAVVRKEQTNFFQSGGCISLSSSRPSESVPRQDNIIGGCTIGAPPYFVENYNIRLVGYDVTTARKLTRYIRTKFPGIVEGLTLPYHNIQQQNSSENSPNGSNDVDDRQQIWEVACNLLRPDLVSHSDVQGCADEWYNNLQNDDKAPFGYRVGTTVQQCREAITVCSKSIEDRRKYDEMVSQRFESYF